MARALKRKVKGKECPVTHGWQACGTIGHEKGAMLAPDEMG
ncbi:hypothetical protein ACTG2C_16005 [Aeromonas veronii]